MGNDTRFALTLGIALLVWSPAALGLFNGTVSFTTAAWRFALALAGSYVALALVNKLIVRYGTENAVRDIQDAEARRASGDVNIDLDR